MKKIILLLIIGSGFLGIRSGYSQTVQKDYPNRPIRMVIPYVAGGPMDFIGRSIGQKISPILGQNFYLDNRGGAGGAIGTDIVAKSIPDGYTILNTSSSHASLPVVSKNLPYDPVKDFLPITHIANSVGFVLAVGPTVTAKNLQDFIADARANPGKYNYGSAGVGNIMQFAAEFFNTSAGTKINHIPYKGLVQVITDLAAGRIDICFGSATTILPFIKSGQVRALAITGQSRWVLMPTVPTVDESGIKGFFYTPWYGFWYPSGTPTAYVDKMRYAINKALEDPDLKKNFSDQGFITIGGDSEAFAKIIGNDIESNKTLASKIDFVP
jgi:tripartite-type tricarboxylate transporter receptor subunit TctC